MKVIILKVYTSFGFIKIEHFLWQIVEVGMLQGIFCCYSLDRVQLQHFLCNQICT